MRKKRLSNEFLSAFCLELSLLLHSGVTVGDGLHLLAEDDVDKSAKELFETLADITDQGYPISHALAEVQVFPEYLVQMAVTGERSGRLEDTFRSLSEYYDSRDRLNTRIRTALLYPMILVVLMLAVIVVLMLAVLPIFNEVYQQLGGHLTGIGAGLLQFGQTLSGGLPILLAVLAVIALAVILYFAVPAIRDRVSSFYRAHLGDKGVMREITSARFASAFSMGLASGMPMDDSLELAASFQKDYPKAQKRYEKCRELMDSGEGFAASLSSAGIFPAAYCRMLSFGTKSGTEDTVMAEIAQRMETSAEEHIERIVGKVEPTLIIISSIIVGVIILSVMMPLMNIMSAIG